MNILDSVAFNNSKLMMLICCIVCEAEMKSDFDSDAKALGLNNTFILTLALLFCWMSPSRDIVTCVDDMTQSLLISSPTPIPKSTSLHFSPSSPD